jgi:hypothetical protein
MGKRLSKTTRNQNFGFFDTQISSILVPIIDIYRKIRSVDEKSSHNNGQHRVFTPGPCR